MSDVEAAAFSLSALTANSIIKKANLKKGYKILVTSLFSNTSLSCLEILKGIAANVQMFSMHIGKIGDLYVSLHRSKGLLWKKRRICIR